MCTLLDAGWSFGGADQAAFRVAVTNALLTYRKHPESYRWVGACGCATAWVRLRMHATVCSWRAVDVCGADARSLVGCRRGVQLRGMEQDQSWDQAAQKYEAVLLAAKYQW